MGEIIVRGHVSSKVMEVTVGSGRRGSISSTLHSRPSSLVKIKKAGDHVCILGFPGEFPSVTIESIEGDRVDFETVSARF